MINTVNQRYSDTYEITYVINCQHYRLPVEKNLIQFSSEITI